MIQSESYMYWDIKNPLISSSFHQLREHKGMVEIKELNFL